MVRWPLPAALLAALALLAWLAWPAPAGAQPAELAPAAPAAGATAQAATASLEHGTAGRLAPAREEVSASPPAARPLRELPVRVLHGDGTPAAAAQVELYAPIDPGVPAGPLPAPAQSSLSNAEGRCTFEVEPGLWRLRATFGASACSEVLRVDWPKVRVYGFMQLDLRPMALLRGVVLDKHLRAVAGAEVRVRPGCAGRDEDDQVWTDHVGSFALPVLAGRALTAQARWPGGVTLVEALELGAGSERTIELTQLGARHARGTVRDEGGAPVAELRITARREAELVCSTQTDAAGRFRLELAQPGEYMVDVAQAGIVLLSHAVHVTADAEPPALELQLGAAQRIRGRVTMPDGSPCAGCTVLASSRISGNGRRIVEVQTSTGKDGRFEFARIPPGDYDLAVWRPIKSSALPISSRIVPVVTGAGEVEIVVSRLRMAEPQVEFSATDAEGKPLLVRSVVPFRIDAAGQLRTWPGEAFHLRFEDGRARLFGLPEGRTFVFSVGAHSRASYQTQAITIGGAQRIQVELPLPGAIRLVVRRPPGIGTEDIQVFAGKAVREGAILSVVNPELADGAWIWRVDPGSYHLTASVRRAGGTTTGKMCAVTVEAGRTAEAEIDLVSDSFPPFSGRTPDPRPGTGR